MTGLPESTGRLDNINWYSRFSLELANPVK